MRLLALLLAAACGPLVAETPRPLVLPDGGVATAVHYAFAWKTGAALDVPIAEGAQSAIWVSPGLDGIAAVRTSDASVATFGIDGTGIAVAAHAPGTADAILLDAAGAELGRIAVHVAPTVALATRVAAGKLIVYDGALENFHVSTVGPGGQDTVGVGGVTFAVSGAAVATQDPSIFGVPDDSVWFYGYGGSGTVTASTPHASLTLDVEFVAPTQLVSIVPSVEQRDGYTDVVFVSSAADGPVYGAWPDCTSPMQVLGGGVSGIEDRPYAFYRYSLAGHGAFTLSCRLGAHQLSVPVSY